MMKTIKSVSLVAIAALVAMAMVGATSASATKLCKTNTKGCSGYTAGTILQASLASGTEQVFDPYPASEYAEVTCPTAEFKMETKAEWAAELLPLANQSWINGGCLYRTSPGSIGGTCTFTTINPNVSWNLKFTENDKAQLILGTTVQGKQFELKWVCGSNPAFPGSSCTYRIPSGTIFDFEGGSPAAIKANKVTIVNTGGLSPCGSEGTYSATFNVTSPTPLHVVSK
jgi:hypothetical protein